MRNSSRPVSHEKQLTRLKKKHATLKERVAELDSRLHLTAAEEMRVQSLKKEKLATKDELVTLSQRINGHG